MNEEIEMFDEFEEFVVRFSEVADIILSCGYVMILDKYDESEEWVFIRKEDEAEWIPDEADIPY